MIPGHPDATEGKPSPPTAGVCVVDSGGNVLAANEVAQNWLGENSGCDAEGGPLAGFLATPPIASALRSVFADEGSVAVRAEWPGHALQPTPALVQLHRIDSPAGPQAVAIIHLAPLDVAHTTDALTGLPDRRALAARAADWHREPVRGGFALLFLDLDDFKRVNDQFGHAAGDSVLSELSARWLQCVREGDLVARYGGDEFVFLLKNVSEAAETAPVLERLHDVTEGAIDLGDLPIRMTCTIGVALSPHDGAGVDDLIAAADRDMYARKRSTRSAMPQ